MLRFRGRFTQDVGVLIALRGVEVVRDYGFDLRKWIQGIKSDTMNDLGLWGVLVSVHAGHLQVGYHCARQIVATIDSEFDTHQKKNMRRYMLQCESAPPSRPERKEWSVKGPQRES